MRPLGRVPAGTYVWEAHAYGYPPVTGTVEVPHGVERDILVTFRKGGVLRGRIEPMPEDRRVFVQTHQPGEPAIAPQLETGTRVEPDGSFEVLGLPPGKTLLALLIVNVATEQLTLVRDRVTIRPAAITEHVLRWSEPSIPVRLRLGHPSLEELLLRVRDARGEPVYEGVSPGAATLCLGEGTDSFEGYPPRATRNVMGFDLQRGAAGKVSEPDAAGVHTVTFDFPE